MTAKYPDIVQRVPWCLASGIDSCVLDGEAVAWDAEHRKLMPFQVGDGRCAHTCFFDIVES